MRAFFIWTLVKAIVLISSGYLVYKAVDNSGNDKQNKKLEEKFEQVLKDNAYENFQPEIEIANKISGLQIHRQKYTPNIKPVFYFRLDNKNTEDEIKTFLSTLPDNFLVNVPALKISIEDSKPKNIYFWKSQGLFQLTYQGDNRLILLGTPRCEELAGKIYNESATYNLQNISVKRLFRQATLTQA